MIERLLEQPFALVLVVLVAVLGVGRLVRIATYDDFPPSAWARAAWARLTNDGPWSKLATCAWCATPWVMLACIGWFLATPLAPWVAWSWWLFWGWLALAYVSTMIYVRDEPPEH